MHWTAQDSYCSPRLAAADSYHNPSLLAKNSYLFCWLKTVNTTRLDGLTTQSPVGRVMTKQVRVEQGEDKTKPRWAG